jgi:hypothetical protein
MSKLIISIASTLDGVIDGFEWFVSGARVRDRSRPRRFPFGSSSRRSSWAGREFTTKRPG